MLCGHHSQSYGEIYANEWSQSFDGVSLHYFSLCCGVLGRAMKLSAYESMEIFMGFKIRPLSAKSENLSKCYGISP
jgi:hypothetical protein